MTSAHTWIEPFAGSLAVALHLLGTVPPIGYAGNKRYPASRIAGMLWPYVGLPDKVVVADVGPWRTVWEEFASGHGDRILDVMLSWPDVDDVELWYELVQTVPTEPEVFAAVYLYLQARQAHHAPIWVRPEGWVSRGDGDKGESHPNHRPADWRCGGGNGGTSVPGHSHATWARAGRREEQQTAPAHRSYGTDPTRPPRWGRALSRATLIARIRSLLPLPWERFQVLGDYKDAMRTARKGDVVYADPPYFGASVRYPGTPPTELEVVALETAERGVRVAISEARSITSLVSAGWEAQDVTAWFRGKRKPESEWITWLVQVAGVGEGEK